MLSLLFSPTEYTSMHELMRHYNTTGIISNLINKRGVTGISCKKVTQFSAIKIARPEY